jgi:hypothetical protein
VNSSRCQRAWFRGTGKLLTAKVREENPRRSQRKQLQEESVGTGPLKRTRYFTALLMVLG